MECLGSVLEPGACDEQLVSTNKIPFGVFYFIYSSRYNSEMKYWLMKSEPSEFSIDDLESVGYQLWDGIRNYQVRNMFRDEMKKGDNTLFYHSSCADIGVVGEMEILIPAEIDLAQFYPNNKYYDAKSTKDNPRWLGPVVKFKKKFKNLVTLTEIKLDPTFTDLPLIRKGNRLSVMPISKTHYELIVKLSN